MEKKAHSPVRVSVEDEDAKQKFLLNNTKRSDEMKNFPEMPDRDMSWFVKNVFGNITVVIVYIFFIKIYTVTFIYTLYPFNSTFLDTMHMILFTTTTCLSLWCHLVSMLQQPGVLALDYESLNINNISLKFAKLFDERDLQHIGPVFRRLKRSGQEAEAKQLIEDQKRQSVYLKVKSKAISGAVNREVETTEGAIRNAEE